MAAAQEIAQPIEFSDAQLQSHLEANFYKCLPNDLPVPLKIELQKATFSKVEFTAGLSNVFVRMSKEAFKMQLEEIMSQAKLDIDFGRSELGNILAQRSEARCNYVSHFLQSCTHSSVTHVALRHKYDSHKQAGEYMFQAQQKVVGENGTFHLVIASCEMTYSYDSPRQTWIGALMGREDPTIDASTYVLEDENARTFERASLAGMREKEHERVNAPPAENVIVRILNHNLLREILTTVGAGLGIAFAIRTEYRELRKIWEKKPAGDADAADAA